MCPLSVTTGKKATCCRHTQISSRDIKVVICYYSETRVSVLKLYSRQWCTKISISRSIWGCMTIMRSRRSHRRDNQSCSHSSPKLTARLIVMTTPQSHRSQPLRVASACLSSTCFMQSDLAHEVICKQGWQIVSIVQQCSDTSRYGATLAHLSVTIAMSLMHRP